MAYREKQPRRAASFTAGAAIAVAIAGFVSDAQAGDLLNIAKVAPGIGYTCALTTTGGVKCWGSNEAGRLGNGGTSASQTPVDVVGLQSGVVSIANGGHSMCALTASGGVKCWGRNAFGTLGDGTTTDRSTPVDVPGLTSGVSAIAVGSHHACAVVGGGVKCWGYDAFGQFGSGAMFSLMPPVDIPGLSGVTAIAVGSEFTCVVTASGGAKCWGINFFGQLGYSAYISTTPGDVVGLTSGVASITAGYGHACAVTTAGAAKCWGDNQYGQVGDGTTTLRSGPDARPIDVLGLSSGVSRITAARGGGAHTCAVMTAGGVECWGDNQYGQVGAIGASKQLSPVGVPGVTGGVIDVAASHHHTCAVTTTGTVRCWGENASGQLGNSSLGFGVPVTVGYPAAAQTVTFQPIPGHDVNDPPVAFAASASSGLPVTFSSSSPSTCTVSSNTAVLVEIGICTIVARQAGNADFSGTEASRSFLVTGNSPASSRRLGNISTRMQVLTGNDSLIAGFAIQGPNSQKTVLIRARGPSLSASGVANPVQNPALELYSGQTRIDGNDDHASFRNAATIAQIGLAPPDSRESAILVTLANGLYTAIVTGSAGTGVGLVEVFEIDRPDAPLINISTRGRVSTGEDVMIAGFIVHGTSPQTVVVRARGPSLTQQGVAGVLANPTMRLVRSSDQATIATNDDWQLAANAATLQSSGFAPSNAQESAILITLNPGAYTAIVSGAGGTTGVGIVEVFAVP